MLCPARPCGSIRTLASGAVCIIWRWGLNYLPIDYFLQQHPQVKNVVLCFDRDEPGLRFAETVTKRLAERGCNVEKRLPAVGKDYNESLIWYKSKIEKQRGERV